VIHVLIRPGMSMPFWRLSLLNHSNARRDVVMSYQHRLSSVLRVKLLPMVCLLLIVAIWGCLAKQVAAAQADPEETIVHFLEELSSKY